MSSLVNIRSAILLTAITKAAQFKLILRITQVTSMERVARIAMALLHKSLFTSPFVGEVDAKRRVRGAFG
jgi:hypothetical protein